MIIHLLRPINLVITVIAVITGWLLSSPGYSFQNIMHLVLSSLALALTAASGYIFNDVRDVATDIINKPDRLIPSGKISVSTALVIAGLLMVTGVGVSWYVGKEAFYFILVITVLLVLYSMWLSAIMIAGNLVVAIVASSPFVYGSYAVGGSWEGALVTALALPIHFVREVLKDIEDIRGDRIAFRKTLPICTSPSVSVRLAGIVMLMTAIAVPVPYLVDLYSWIYLAVAGVFVAIPLMIWSSKCLLYPERVAVSTMQRNLKIIMIPGILAFLLDGVLF